MTLAETSDFDKVQVKYHKVPCHCKLFKVSLVFMIRTSVLLAEKSTFVHKVEVLGFSFDLAVTFDFNMYKDGPTIKILSET